MVSVFSVSIGYLKIEKANEYEMFDIFLYLVIGGPSDDIGDNDSPEFYGLPWLPDGGLRISKPSIQAFRKQAGSETGKFSRPLTEP